MVLFHSFDIGCDGKIKKTHRTLRQTLLAVGEGKSDTAFLKYLKSPQAQQIIAEFGKGAHEGFALFTPAAQMDF
jgi:hypothetical protein